METEKEPKTVVETKETHDPELHPDEEESTDPEVHPDEEKTNEDIEEPGAGTQEASYKFQKDFEFAQLLKEINPHFKRGIVPMGTTFFGPPAPSYYWQQNAGYPGIPTPPPYPPAAWTQASTPYVRKPAHQFQPTNGAPYVAYNGPQAYPWANPYTAENGRQYQTQGMDVPFSENPTTDPYQQAPLTDPYQVPYRAPLPGNGNPALGTAYRSSFWQQQSINPTFAFVPPANILEYENQFTIELLVPGFKDEDCRIKFSNGILWIYGVRDTESIEAPDRFHTTREFDSRSFRRLFMLSEDVDIEHTTSQLLDGILTIDIKKKDLASQREMKVSELNPS